MQLEFNRRPQRRLISLTPLIDVVFILLLFFMLASSFQQWRSMSINAPAKGVAKPSEQRALLLQVRVGGKLELDGEPLSAEALATRLQDYLAANPEQAVVVQPDPEVGLQTLVEVFDRLAAAGVRELTLGAL